MDTVSKPQPDPTQAEREAAVAEAWREYVDILRPHVFGEPPAEWLREGRLKVERLARAAGRAEERVLTDQFQYDATQERAAKDAAEERIEALEGALREIEKWDGEDWCYCCQAWTHTYYSSGYSLCHLPATERCTRVNGTLCNADMNPVSAAEKLTEIAARALLPKASEGSG